MAFITDKQGKKWEVRFSLRVIAKLARKMSITIAQLTILDVPLADLLESLPIICAKEIKAAGIGLEEFEDRIDEVPLPEVLAALKEAVTEAFPSAGDQGGAARGPFDLGNSETSSDSQPSPESIPTATS